MERRDDCIFCKIVAGEAPCARVTEDDRTLVFMDLFPVSEGHTLVVTKEHFENLHEATAESIAAVGAMSKRVADALAAEWRPDGLSVYQANGVAAGQTVFHYHMHLMPRSNGSPLTLHGRVQADADVLREHAERIARRLDPPS
ncbi:MAG TPA: HIT family protein [Myxococcota bacterium]|nr:HIT family protein [Myxococcota bacterium]